MPGYKKICFFVAPIGEPESKIRNRSDQVFKHIVRPAAKRCGYQALRADELPGTTQRIIPKIFHHLHEDSMVVADLTGLNPNVFYELGYRRALGKPVVLLIQRGHKLPFDVFDVPTVFYDLTVDEVVECRQEVVEKIREAEKEAVPEAIKAKQTISKARRIKMAIRKPKPLSPEEMEILGSAQRLKEDGAYEEALEKADHLVSHRPEKVEPYILKGRIYLESLKQFHAAVKEFKKALDLDPTNRAVLYDLALTYYYTGNLVSAIKWNEKALEQNPDFVLAIYNHAIYCVDYGEKYNDPVYLHKAIELYKDVIRRDQEYAESAMFNLAALYADFYEEEQNWKLKSRYVKDAVSLLDEVIKREGIERLRKVTGEIPIPYGSSLKKISRHPTYKKLLAKWKKTLFK